MIAVTGIVLVRDNPGRSDAASRSAGALATTAVPDGGPLSTTASPTGSALASPSTTAPGPSSPASRPVPAGGPKLLIGIGTEADVARRTALAKQAPVKMLTSWYNGPGDLGWMAGWQNGTVPGAYAAGYALHLVVWAGDSEGQVSTAHGTACGRGYPLSNARVSLGWGGWQGSFDSPGDGGGRSMLPHFADVLAMSDFQSLQAMDSGGNMTDIRTMTTLLGAYGPVLVAHYKPDNGSPATFDADMRALFTDATLRSLTAAGLFGFSFMDNTNLNSTGTFAFVKGAVTRYGGGW